MTRSLEECRRETLLGGRVEVWRSDKVYPPTIDAVLLAATIAAPSNASILDVGTGGGAASLVLLARNQSCAVTGLDMSGEAVALAGDSARLNHLEARFEAVTTDLADAAERLDGRQFDVVMTNPPFHDPEDTRHSPDPARSRAHLETMPIDRWLRLSIKRLRSSGWMHIIHRADRLPELLTAMVPHLGDLRILPIYPRAGKAAATRVIVAGKKGSKARSQLLQGLVLHDRDGDYADAAQAILRDGLPLAMTEQG